MPGTSDCENLWVQAEMFDGSDSLLLGASGQFLPVVHVAGTAELLTAVQLNNLLCVSSHKPLICQFIQAQPFFG